MRRSLRLAAGFVAVLAAAVLLYASRDFPAFGDPDSPASRHVSPYYITHAYEETEVPNIVTAILADYRNFDTSLETVVVFTAMVAIILILRGPLHADDRRFVERRPPPREAMARPYRVQPLARSLIIEHACRLMVPPIQLFAFYVLAHGHHSPGGGFQGGVILGASFILLAIGFDLPSALRRYPPRLQLTMATLGVLLYTGTGVVCLLLGGNFYDYGVLARILPVGPTAARSLGILVVETGVLLTVSAVIFSIYVDLSSHGGHREGL